MFKRSKIGMAVLATVSGGALVVADSSWAQATQRVEITGSAIKRIQDDAALPVQIITREEIQRTGATSTEALLNSIAAVSSMGSTQNATGAGSSTNGISTLSLRGLSGSRTLVLVNGRRLAVAAGGGGASVNVNNIPLAAIERIEVLKDGASSIYGSEALAGVVNFILTKEFTGVDIGLSVGQPTRSGGGRNEKVTLTAGFGNLSKDNFNVTVTGGLEREKALFGRQRDFSAKSDIFPYQVGSATGQGAIQGGWNAAGTVDANAADPWSSFKVPGFAGGGLGGSYGTPVAAQGKCADIRMFDAGNVSKIGSATVPATAAARQTGRYCMYDSGGDVGLIPDREVASFSLNGAFRINDNLELFGDALYSNNKVTQTFQPSPVRNSFLQTVPDPWIRLGYSPVLLINPTNPNYGIASAYLTSLANAVDPALAGAPAGTTRRNEILNIIGRPLAITARVFDFGPRSTLDETTQTRLVAGARGTVLNQGYELAFASNQNKLEGTTRSGYFSQTKYANAVSNNNEWNPWSLTQTPGFNAAIAPANYVGSTLGAETKSNSVDAKLTGDLFSLPGGFAQYAAGIAYRTEGYKLRPSAAYLEGDISGLGGNVVPLDRDRKITSGFAEIGMPVLKGLEANLSARSDRYNDAGNASTYKASLRWQPVKQVALRMGTGTGFRAPTLEELWYPQTTGTSETYVDPRFPGVAFQSQLTTGGNPALKPEKSKQQSIGMVFQPTNAISASFDYWKIDIDQIIATPSTQEVVSRFRAGDAAYAGLVDLSPNNEVDRVRAITANVGKAKLEGVDVDAQAKFGLPVGRLDMALSGTYMIRFDQTSPGGSLSKKVGTMVEDGLDEFGDRVSSPVLGAEDGGVVLRWKHRLSATYVVSDWSFTVAQNYYTGYRTADRQYDAELNFVKAQSLFDLHLGYTGIKGLRLSLGVKNVEDKNPPIYVPSSNQFQSGYDISLYDPRARFVYVSANYKF